MNEIDFCCKGCVFAVMNNEGNQTSCVMNDRHIKLSNDNLSFKDGYARFNRFCNMFRPESWKEQYANNDIEKAMDLVTQETYPRLTFILEFNKDMEFFKSLLEKINSQSINTRKFVVVVNSEVEYNLDIFSLMQKTLTNNIGGFNLVQVIDSDKIFDEAFSKAKNGWTVFLKGGQDISVNLAENLNNRINNSLRRMVYAESQDSGKTIVQSAIYKMLGGNQPLMRGDGTIDNRPFKDKLAEMISEDKDSITTWEELFNE
jgi:hypothetical protein